MSFAVDVSICIVNVEIKGHNSDEGCICVAYNGTRKINGGD